MGRFRPFNFVKKNIISVKNDYVEASRKIPLPSVWNIKDKLSGAKKVFATPKFEGLTIEPIDYSIYDASDQETNPGTPGTSETSSNNKVKILSAVVLVVIVIAIFIQKNKKMASYAG
jgi:hypothetical protein